jgi:nuclear transport factor 2 (NTF2) superfamily protein
MVERVRAVEDAWNRRDLDAVVLSSSIDCQWRCRAESLWGREQIRQFLTRKWRREIDLRIINELWVWDGLRIAVRFSSEFRDDSGTWFRTYGNENWECDASGLVRRRLSSANAHPIEEHERKLRWPPGIRPPDYPALSELGL